MKSYLPYLILPLLLCTACVKEVDFDLDDRNLNTVVIDGWITSVPSQHEIKLTRTRDFSDLSDPAVITGAQIEFRWSGGVEVLQEEGNGLYLTTPDFALIPEEFYEFKVTVDGEEYTYGAEMPGVPDIEAADFEVDGDSASINVIIDQENVGNSFLLTRVFVGEEIDGDTNWIPLRETLFTADVDVLDFEDGEFDDFDVDIGDVPDPEEQIYLIEVHALPQSLFNYLVTLRNDEIEGLYSSYPTNPEVLFSNQALGAIFHSSASQLVIVPEE